MATQFTDTIVSRRGLSPATFPPEEIRKLRRGWNSRHKVSQARIEELAHAIASCPVGQFDPVLIRKGEGGYGWIIAGNTRTDAILFINDNLDHFRSLYPSTVTGPFSLKALVQDCNETEAIELSLAENLDHLGLSPVDKAQAYRDLKARGWENDRIANALRCSVSTLDQLKKILTLDETARESLHNEFLTGQGITNQLAQALVGLPTQEVKEVVREVEEGKVTPAEATRKVNQKKRSNGVRVTMSFKEITDIFKDKEKAGSWIAADFLTCFQGNHIRTLPEMIDLYDQDPTEIEAHQTEYELLKGKAARVDQLEVEMETLLNWIANNLGDDTRDLAEKELQQARELAQALAGIGATTDQEAEVEAGTET